MLMLPVTIGLGIVNLDQLINSAFGSLVSERSSARDRQRVSHLHAAAGHVQRGGRHRAVPDAQPHGLEPRRGRDAPRGRQRHAPDQPAADPRRGVHGRCWRRRSYGSCSSAANSTPSPPISCRSRCSGSRSACPFGGLNLLLTRTFFAVQRPWIPTSLAAMNIVVDIVVSVALYKPLGIAGLIIGTVAANVVMTALQFYRLRVGFNGRLEGAQTTMITVRIVVASALLAGVSWGVWKLLDELLGDVAAGADRQRRRRRRGGPVRVRARGAGHAHPRGPPGEQPDPRAARPRVAPSAGSALDPAYFLVHGQGARGDGGAELPLHRGVALRALHNDDRAPRRDLIGAGRTGGSRDARDPRRADLARRGSRARAGAPVPAVRLAEQPCARAIAVLRRSRVRATRG